MNRLRLLCAVGIFLAGCKVKNTVPGLVEFKCNDAKSFWVDYGKDFAVGKPLPDSAIFHFGDQAIRLPKIPDESTIRYSDQFTTFTNRGGVAGLTTRQGGFENCRAAER